MNRRLVSLLLAGVLAASMLTACGTGGESSSQTPPTPSGSQVEDAQGSASPQGEEGSSEKPNP